MKVVRIILTVLLSIILALAILLVGTVYFLRDTLSRKTVVRFMESIDPAEMSVSDFNISSNVLSDLNLDSESNLYELIAAFINKNIPDASVTTDQIHDFFESTGVENIKTFIEEKSGAYMDEFLEGNEEGKIEAEELIELIKSFSDDIKDYTGIELEEENFDKLKSAFEEMKIERISVSSLKDQYPALNKIGKALSKATFIASIVVTALLALIIILINLTHLSTGFKSVAIPSMVVAIIFIVLSGLFALAKQMIKYLLKGLPFIINNLVDAVSAKPLLLYGLVLFAIGIVLTILSVIMSKAERSKENS